MSAQKFYASPTDTLTFQNGAIGHRSGVSFDCLGPYAKVRNCPIAGTTLRLTCYATGYADTYFSVPACTRYKGKYISGYFSMSGHDIEFRPMNRHRDRLPAALKVGDIAVLKGNGARFAVVTLSDTQIVLRGWLGNIELTPRDFAIRYTWESLS